MSDIPLLSLIIPTRNEAENLPTLLERIDRAMTGISTEICIVDDSDDQTAQLLEELQTTRGETIRIRLRSGAERDGGLSTAVVEGLRMARGTYVCVLDADLQHPPELISSMLKKAEQGADLIVASRYIKGSERGGLESSMRRLVSRAATSLAKLLFIEARQSSDPLSGFFLCRRSLIDGIEFRPVGFKILLELLVCVPAIKVVDVPLRFERRNAGASKASPRQGILFLRHIASLFWEVRGSARAWKFGLVGLSGLLIFLPTLTILTRGFHVAPLVAFLPAFAFSVAWNTVLNRLWTFADRRRKRSGEGAGRYLRGALLSGGVMFLVFAGLTAWHWTVESAGLLAAFLAMGSNAWLNNKTVSTHPATWAKVAINQHVQAGLAELATQIGANRAYALPADRGVDRGEIALLPAEIFRRVVSQRRPVLWTEAASSRPQRRINIDMNSFVMIPVIDEQHVIAVVVCERQAPRGFDAAALETATNAVDRLAELLRTAMQRQ